MAINFPDSPSLNDLHIEGGRRWKWNGTVWERIPAPGAQGVIGAQGAQGVQGAQGLPAVGSTNKNLIVPDAYAVVGTASSGVGLGINWGAYNSSNGRIEFAFHSAQPNNTYYVHTNREHYATHNIEVFSKTTTGFTTKWSNSDGSNLSPATFHGVLIVYPSDPIETVGIGAQGYQGVQGAQGAQGRQGATGSQGAQGHQGVQGAQGAQGHQGRQGAQGVQGAVGAQGAQGAQGHQGHQGAVGAQGKQGTVGAQGADGNFGGATFDYTFDTTTSDADPGAGKLRLNNALVNAATVLYIDDEDAGGTDIQSFLRTIDDSTSTVKGHFRISNRLDATDYALYTISGTNTEATGYHKVNCGISTASAVSFSNNEDIIITFARTGTKGDTGAQGAVGAQGAQGHQGVQGAQGHQGVQGAQGRQGATGAQGHQGHQGVQGATGATTTINNNANNKVITGSGTANTLEAEASLTFDAGLLKIDDLGGTAGKGRLEFGNSGEQYIEGYDTGNAGSGSYLTIGSNTDERLRITSTGLVGINCTPNKQLEVKGTDVAFRLLSTVATGRIGMEFYDTSAQKGFFGYASTSNDEMSIQQNEAADLWFYVNGAERLRIDSSGRLGLGQATPVSKLHISETGSNTINIQLTNATTGHTYGSDGMTIGYSSSSSVGFINVAESSSGFIIKTGGTAAGNERFRITSAGTIQIGGATSNSADIDASNSRLTIKQSANSQEDGIYIERSGERRGWYQYVGGGLSSDDALCFNTNQLGTDTEVLALDRSGVVKIAGNLGVGINDPSQARLVAQTASGMSIAAIKDNTGASISLGGVTQPRILLEAGASANEFKLYTATGSSYGSAGWSEKVRVTSDGELRQIGSSNNLGQGDIIAKYTQHTLDPTTPGGAGEVFKIYTYSANANGADYSTWLYKRAGSAGGECGIRLGGSADGSINFYTSPNSSTAYAERLRIDSSGRVGINKFTHVDTSSALTIQNGVSGSDHTILDIVCNDNETCRIYFSEDSNSGKGSIRYTYTSDSNHMGFYTNGTASSNERLRITSTGVIESTSQTITGGNNLDKQAFAVKRIYSGSPAVGKSAELISGYDGSVKMAAVAFNLTDTNVGGTYGGDLTFHTQPLYSSPTTPVPVSMRINSSGMVTTPNQPGFLAVGRGGYSGSIDSSWAIVYPNSEIYDTLGNHNLSTGTFTAPVAGKYLFYCYGLIYPMPDSNFCQLRFVRNGSTYGQLMQFSGTAGNHRNVSMSVVASLSKNDTFAHMFYRSSGQSQNVYGGQWNWGGVLLG